jgi:hypothetical protein
VRRACPDGKTPCLLLTDDDSVGEGYVETEQHLVFVLNLPRYLATNADPSLAYVAHRLGSGVTRLGPLNEQAAERAQAGAALLESEIGLEQISVWMSELPERREQLRQLAAASEGEGIQSRLRGLLESLEQLPGDLDPELISALGRLCDSTAGRDLRIALLREITSDPTGRYVVGEVLAGRNPERIADARKAMSAYQALLDDSGTTETAMQHFFEANLWLLGLDYGEMRSGQPILLGEMDFFLERFDGFHDLLELKSPRDEIIRIAGSHTTSVPPASAYSLSPALSKALAQVHVYRDRLTRHADTTADLYGLSHTRDPRLIIVIGRADPLPEHSKRVLTELNKSLHRVEIVPYDVLARRATAALDNVDKYRLAAREDEG